jgi:hypothetical protein
MIGLSAPTVDANGAVILKENRAKSTANEPPARISKSKCLDGTVSITHSGVCDGDRTFRLVIPQITEAEYTVVKRLHRNYTEVVFACRDGVFVGVIAQPIMSGGNCTIKIEAKEKLSAD